MDRIENLSVENEFHQRCRICLLTDEEAKKRMIFNACNCKGASGGVHVDCLESWISASHRDDCEICLQKINFEKVPKYGLLKSIAIFFYSSRTIKILILIMLAAVTIYTMSIIYVDRLSSTKPHSARDKIFVFFANLSIFSSVFVISYSPLICLYIWDQWKEWRKSQYHLQIRPSVIEI